MELPELLQRIVIDTTGLQSGSAGFEQFVSRAGASMSKMPNIVAASVAAPLLAIQGLALKAAFSVDDANRSIQRSSGETGTALTGLESSFQKVAAAGPDSFGEVSAALVTVHQRTGETGKGLEDLTTQFLDLQRITGQHISFEVLQRTLAAFNVTAKDTPKTLDDIYAASAKSGIPISQLLTLLTTGGPTLRAFGFDIGQSATLLGKLERAGIPATSAMRALQVEYRNAAKAGKEPKQALDDFITTVQNYVKEGNIAGAVQLGTKLFGRPGQGLVEAIAAGKIGLETFNDVVKATGPGIEDTSRKTQSLSEQFKQFKNDATLALAPLGQSIIPQLHDAMDLLVPPVMDAVKWFGQLPTPVVDTALAIGGLAYVAIKFSQNIESMVNVGSQLVSKLVEMRAAHIAAAAAADAQGASEEALAADESAAGAAAQISGSAEVTGGAEVLDTGAKAGETIAGLNDITPGEHLINVRHMEAIAATEAATAEGSLAGANHATAVASGEASAAADVQTASNQALAGSAGEAALAEGGLGIASSGAADGFLGLDLAALGVGGSLGLAATAAGTFIGAGVGLAALSYGIVKIFGLGELAAEKYSKASTAAADQDEKNARNSANAYIALKDRRSELADEIVQLDARQEEAQRKLNAEINKAAGKLADPSTYEISGKAKEAQTALFGLQTRLADLRGEFAKTGSEQKLYHKIMTDFNKLAGTNIDKATALAEQYRGIPGLFGPMEASLIRHKSAADKDLAGQKALADQLANTSAIVTYIDALKRGKATLEDFGAAEETAITASEKSLLTGIDVARARNAATDALTQYNVALYAAISAGGQDADANKAMTDAQYTAEQAVITAADAVDKQVTSLYGAAAGAQAHRQALQDMADQTTGPVHDAIMGLIADLDKIPKNTDASITVRTQVIGAALPDIAGMQAFIDAQNAGAGGYFDPSVFFASTPSDGSLTSTGLNFAAEGGDFLAGQSIVVGEQGPELFVPTTSGTVIPNDQAGDYLLGLTKAFISTNVLASAVQMIQDGTSANLKDAYTSIFEDATRYYPDGHFGDDFTDEITGVMAGDVPHWAPGMSGGRISDAVYAAAQRGVKIGYASSMDVAYDLLRQGATSWHEDGTYGNPFTRDFTGIDKSRVPMLPGFNPDGSVQAPKVFDAGGALQPGMNLLMNRTGAVEHLVPAQSQAGGRDVEQLLTEIRDRLKDRGFASPGIEHFHYHGRDDAESVASATVREQRAAAVLNGV